MTSSYKSAYTKKARDSSVTYPVPQAFACPTKRISNVEAHADMYKNIHSCAKRRMKYTISQITADIYRCPVFSLFKVAKFEIPKTRRQ